MGTMTIKDGAKIPVSAIVQVENVQFPPLSKKKMMELISSEVHYGDNVVINGTPYRYTGEFEES